MSLPIDIKYLRLISIRLRNFKQKNSDLWNFSCPFCGDSKKNLLKARFYVFYRKGGLFGKCHNCGIGVSLGSLIQHVDSSLYSEYVLERYKSGESGRGVNFKQPTFDIPAPRFGKIEKQKTFEHAEWCSELQEGHFCLDYLKHRKVPESFYDKLLFTQHYKLFVDTLIPDHGKNVLDDARLIIPYYNEYNELIAVSGRALQTSDKTLRYVTLRCNKDKNKLVYGMERLDTKKLAKIVEGPLDSMFLSNCVASGDANLLEVAKSLKCDKILIYDNEPRNKELCKMMFHAVQTQMVVIWPDNIEGKDINEMILNGKSIEDIENIISSNTFCGLEAVMKFNFWKKV